MCTDVAHGRRPRLGNVASDEHAHDPQAPAKDWQSTLRARGYRLTPQRELVLRAVEQLGHATPDDVLAAVRQESQAVNISTVYRALELLEELGLVRHAHLTDRAPTYHSTTSPDHVHLVCRSCAAITAVEPGADRAPDTDTAPALWLCHRRRPSHDLRDLQQLRLSGCPATDRCSDISGLSHG